MTGSTEGTSFTPASWFSENLPNELHILEACTPSNQRGKVPITYRSKLIGSQAAEPAGSTTGRLPATMAKVEASFAAYLHCKQRGIAWLSATYLPHVSQGRRQA
ncbi:hypothetical protein RLEG3_03335 (plasmid) [Rhizobium leguminosarum bv. trifolii WSM1689]|nr:hypothetical protein RLEG3_03335 [Rhizobium leguminosarum bv. trifolii WSM1689]